MHVCVCWHMCVTERDGERDTKTLERNHIKGKEEEKNGCTSMV